VANLQHDPGKYTTYYAKLATPTMKMPQITSPAAAAAGQDATMENYARCFATERYQATQSTVGEKSFRGGCHERDTLGGNKIVW
jgi:hypothetical protein